MRVESGGRYAMVGSIGGAPKHPTWYHNVKANPNVTVQDGDKVFEMTAREAQLKTEADTTFFHPSEVELNRTTKTILDEIDRRNPARVVFDLA